jgi:hypothetical protein
MLDGKMLDDIMMIRYTHKIGGVYPIDEICLFNKNNCTSEEAFKLVQKNSSDPRIITITAEQYYKVFHNKDVPENNESET